MAAVMHRSAILHHIRLAPSLLLTAAAAATASHPQALSWWLARPMSSHDTQLTREEVVDCVLDILKSHPKVDPTKILDHGDKIELLVGKTETLQSQLPQTWARAQEEDVASELESCPVQFNAAHTAGHAVIVQRPRTKPICMSA